MNELLQNPTEIIPLLTQLGWQYGPGLVKAILVFWIGKRLARWITDGISKLLRANEVEEELVGFLDSLIYWALFAMVCITALSQLGIQTASFIAILGAAGLAIGLALQGSLSNFAAGVMIIVLRPFRVGDVIEAAGATGKVNSIKIFVTELHTPDNKCIIIPNSRVLESNIVNFASLGTRRVDMVIEIGYDDDIDQARTIIEQVIATDTRVLKDPETTVAVAELADSSVNFVVRPWVESGDYWAVLWHVTETIKKRFDEEGISIPYPQQTLHIGKES